MGEHRRRALLPGILAVLFGLMLPGAMLATTPAGAPPLQGTLTPTAFLYLPYSAREYPSPTSEPGEDCSIAPSLSSPANGSQIDTLLPLFRWDSGQNPNATEFYLELWQDPELTERVWGLRSSWQVEGPGEFRINMNLEPGTPYYWRAYLMCGEDQGPYSEVWSFTTGSGGTVLPGPELLSPPNGSRLAGTTATLQWSAVSGAVEYWVWYSGGGWDRGTRVQETQATLSSTLEPETAYEWWVQARNDYALGEESGHWLFTTAAGEAP